MPKALKNADVSLGSGCEDLPFIQIYFFCQTILSSSSYIFSILWCFFLSRALKQNAAAPNYGKWLKNVFKEKTEGRCSSPGAEARHITEPLQASAQDRKIRKQPKQLKMFQSRVAGEDLLSDPDLRSSHSLLSRTLHHFFIEEFVDIHVAVLHFCFHSWPRQSVASLAAQQIGSVNSDRHTRNMWPLCDASSTFNIYFNSLFNYHLTYSMSTARRWVVNYSSSSNINEEFRVNWTQSGSSVTTLIQLHIRNGLIC